MEIRYFYLLFRTTICKLLLMQNLFEAANGNPLFRQFKVSEMLFTEYKCMEEQSVFDIWSHCNYFVYVLSGKKQWNTRQKEYLVHAGEMIFVKKGANIIHKFFEKDFCALIIFVPDSFIKDVIGTHPLSKSKSGYDHSDNVIPLPLNRTLNTYLQSLYAYFYQKNVPDTSLLELKFKELLLNLASSSDYKDLHAYWLSICQHTKPSIQAIMEANFTYNLSQKEFARICGRSLTIFKRDFKEIYGCSPGRWLTQKRLEHARTLLENTNLPINDLLFDCGFENPSHFTRVFKEKYGTTPTSYKRLNH